MTKSIYVAISQNGVIGKKNDLPWRLPSDLARFRQTTTGHPIIMGRKTHESIGRPLPNRTNIVITRDKDYKADGCIVVGSLEGAIKKAGGSDEIFIIGGSTIYEQALPFTDKIYLTRVKANVDGDVFFNLDESGWTQISSEPHLANGEDQYDYDFVVLERKG